MNKNLGLIVYLAALAAFAPFSTDIYLASMPTLQQVFQTSAASVQLTLSLFLIGFAVAQLFWGPFSDRYGRKPTILIGVSIFVVSSIGCALSQSIVQLILSRIVQAIGACSGIVLAIAIVKDSFPSKKTYKILSIMMSIAAIAPMVAPIVGSYLLAHINWQASFYFLTFYGVILILSTLFIKESHPKSTRTRLPIHQLSRAYLDQVKFTPFLLPLLAISTNFSVMFGFISSSSFIYINIYHLQPRLFGYFFAINAASLILGSLSLSLLKNRISNHKLIYTAILVSFIGAIMMLLAIYLYPKSILSIIIPSFIATYGVGVLNPELTGLALKNVIAHTGLASSLVGTFRFALSAIVGFIIVIVITQSALPLAIAMIIMNLLTAIAMFCYFKHARTTSTPAKVN